MLFTILRGKTLFGSPLFYLRENCPSSDLALGLFSRNTYPHGVKKFLHRITSEIRKDCSSLSPRTSFSVCLTCLRFSRTSGKLSRLLCRNILRQTATSGECILWPPDFLIHGLTKCPFIYIVGRKGWRCRRWYHNEKTGFAISA